MTWSVDGDGNLQISITSSGDLHQIALSNFSDIFRPQVVVIQADMADTTNMYSERLVLQSAFEAEVAGREDIISEADVAGSFAWTNDQAEVAVYTQGTPNTYQLFINSVEEESATWTVDTSTDFITLDWGGDTDTLAVESIMQDSSDLDSDGNTTEEIYSFAGWWQVDATTGLGSFFRDKYFKLP